MSGIRGEDTRPELIVRRGLHARGFRYRLHDRKLPGKPDLVFPGPKAVILVHGCFWHGHGCHLFKWPASRIEFRKEKISGNRERDAGNLARLRDAGWRVLVIRECALKAAEARRGRGFRRGGPLAAVRQRLFRGAGRCLTSGTG